MKTINYKGIEWVVLKENSETTTLITKDILSEDIIKDLTGNDSKYIKFDDETNNYETSYIRSVVNDFVDKYLNKNELQQFNNGDYARLLQAKEVLGYDNELMKSNDWHWTRSAVKGSSYAWYVNWYGYLSNGTVSNSTYRGVRPVICLKSNISNPKEDIETLDYPKIERLKLEYPEGQPNNMYIVNEYGTKCFLNKKHDRVIALKIQELIDEVNKLKDSDKE